MSVRFNEQNEDREYLARITKSKHGEYRRELLEQLSPVAAQKVRNSDEGWTRLLEYLMVYEHDVQVPVVPAYPTRLLNICPPQPPAVGETTDSGDITISEHVYYPQIQDNKQETSSSIPSQAGYGSSHHSYFGSKGYLSQRSHTSEAQQGSQSTTSTSRTSDKAAAVPPTVPQVPTYLPDVSEPVVADDKYSSEHYVVEFAPEVRYPTPSVYYTSDSETYSKSLQYYPSSAHYSTHSKHSAWDEESEEETKELSYYSETVVDKIRRHVVELSDWSDYIRYRASKSHSGCCYRFCVLLLLFLILLGVCFGIYIGIMCCYGGFAYLLSGVPVKPCSKSPDSLTVVSYYDDSGLLSQLSDHQQLLHYLYDYMLKQRNEVTEISASGFYNVASNLSLLYQQLDSVIARVRELENNTDKFDAPEYARQREQLYKQYNELRQLVQGVLATQNATTSDTTQLSKQMQDLRVLNYELFYMLYNLPTSEKDEIYEIIDTHAMLNSDPGTYIDYKKPLGYKSARRQRQLMLQRDYYPGNCYATNQEGYFKIRFRYPALPRFVVIGHPYAQTLVHGRASAPDAVNVAVKVRTSEGDTVKKLGEFRFDKDGKKEQAFDLRQYGLADDDVVLEMQMSYRGDESYVCVYFMGVYGHYLPIRERETSTGEGK